MASVDAQMFIVIGTEAGKLRQKAVTVALNRGMLYGAVLHATPSTFEGAWDTYSRIKNSYRAEGNAVAVQ
jgi:hypothetical protein